MAAAWNYLQFFIWFAPMSIYNIYLGIRSQLEKTSDVCLTDCFVSSKPFAVGLWSDLAMSSCHQKCPRHVQEDGSASFASIFEQYWKCLFVYFTTYSGLLLVFSMSFVVWREWRIYLFGHVLPFGYEVFNAAPLLLFCHRRHKSSRSPLPT